MFASASMAFLWTFVEYRIDYCFMYESLLWVMWLYIYMNKWIVFFFSCSDHSVELILCRFRFRLKFREFYKTEHMPIWQHIVYIAKCKSATWYQEYTIFWSIHTIYGCHRRNIWYGNWSKPHNWIPPCETVMWPRTFLDNWELRFLVYRKFLLRLYQTSCKPVRNFCLSDVVSDHYHSSLSRLNHRGVNKYCWFITCLVESPIFSKSLSCKWFRIHCLISVTAYKL